MKTVKVFFIAFHFCLYNVLAQSCGQYYSDPQLHKETTSTNPNSIINVRVQWYQLRDGGGHSDNSPSLINSIITEVTNEFSQKGINLISDQCPTSSSNFTTIDNQELSDNFVIDYLNDEVCDFTSFCKKDGLSVILMDKLHQATGSSKIAKNICIARVGTIDDFIAPVHEIGHCFGLLHTNSARYGLITVGANNLWTCEYQSEISGFDQGVTGCDQNGILYSNFVPMEFVDGTNSSTSGDFVSDAPADVHYPILTIAILKTINLMA